MNNIVPNTTSNITSSTNSNHNNTNGTGLLIGNDPIVLRTEKMNKQKEYAIELLNQINQNKQKKKRVKPKI